MHRREGLWIARVPSSGKRGKEMTSGHRVEVAAERERSIVLWMVVGITLLVALIVSTYLFQYFTKEFWNYTQWEFTTDNPKMAAMSDAELQKTFHDKAVSVAEQFTPDPALQAKLLKHFSVKVTRRELARVEFDLRENMLYHRRINQAWEKELKLDTEYMPYSPEELRIYLVEIYAQLDPAGEIYYTSFRGDKELRERLLTGTRK